MTDPSPGRSDPASVAPPPAGHPVEPAPTPESPTSGQPIMGQPVMGQPPIGQPSGPVTVPVPVPAQAGPGPTSAPPAEPAASGPPASAPPAYHPAASAPPAYHPATYGTVSAPPAYGTVSGPPAYGPASGPPSYPQAAPVSPGYPIHGQVMIPPPPRNGMAVASLVLALAGLVTFGVTGPIGAILGHIARRRIRETGEQGDTLARFGLIIGWVMTGYLIAVTSLCVVGFMLPTVSTLNP